MKIELEVQGLELEILEGVSKTLRLPLPCLVQELLGSYCRLLSGEVKQAKKVRDLSLYPLLPGIALVIACDSDGGIGPKEHDLVRISAYELGRFGTRVPLLELLAAGAKPFLVVDTLTVEMEPTGKEIIAGVADEVRAAGLDPAMALTGSTEDNVPTTSTGMGVTAIGVVREADLRAGKSLPRDMVVCVGVRKSGPEDQIISADPEIMDLPAMVRINSLPCVHDVLPVGSRGIFYEAQQLARSAGLAFCPDPYFPLDGNKSGGPGSCVLVTLSAENYELLHKISAKPCFVVGRLDAVGEERKNA
ncbi:AIR synthase related protein [Zhaonella formicivorans]|uniref:AIR synthase related protein n=1 Tax=Zhaonella formicivorans TaxID=2528593 RepID=UPI0010F1F6BC|nr:AIR synthase related protein [Zhaonella formicivorans]